MTMHPRDRRTPLWTPGPSGLGRREFLRRSALAALAVPSATALLAACGGDGDLSTATTTGGGSETTWPNVAGIDLARLDHPVELPLTTDPIADGLEPEAGPLKIYNYQDYINPDTIAAFEAEYGVKVEYTPFAEMAEALTKINSGGVDFDLFFATVDNLGELVAREHLQPLNHSYLPNLSNVWAQLQDPFYDVGARYTVPYVLWNNGIGWRTDKIDARPDDYDNGWDVLWDPANAGLIWVLQDRRDTLSLPLLRAGDMDVNTEDPAKLEASLAALRELADRVEVKIGAESYSKVPEGAAPMHYTWSGDMIGALQYLPDGVTADQLGYWAPPDGRTVVNNDTMAVFKDAEHPVLAHLFMNFLLDVDRSLENFTWTGYQPPLTAVDPERLVADGYVPENLSAAIVREADLTSGAPILALTPAGSKRWDDAWARFIGG